MKYPHFRYQKHPLIASLALAVLVLLTSVASAATISDPTLTPLTANSSFSIDATATDFYIFGENVKKKGGPAAFTDVSATPSSSVANASTSEVKIVWTGGDPNDSTGSTQYDYVGFGSSFNPRGTEAKFTLTMPSAEGTLDFWLIPNGNTKDIKYRVTVGNKQKELTGNNISYQRFTYKITQATPGETITVTVNNVTGGNVWHNIGFQAAQLISTVVKQNQTITFVAPSSQLTFGKDTTFDPQTTASSKLPVTYTATGVCTLDNGKIKLTGAGDCTVTASQAGNDSYNAAPSVTQTFKISKATQTLSFATPPTRGTVGQTATLSVTATSDLTNVKLASSTQTVCTVNGNQVKFIDSGICTVTASQAGDNNYLAAQTHLEITVAGPPTVIQSTDKHQVGDPAFPLNVKSSAELPVELTLDPQSQGICTLNGTLVTPVGIGTCIIHAFQPGDAMTNPAQAEYQIEIIPANKDEQSIVFNPVSSGIVGQTATLIATANSGLTVSLASTTPSICTLGGNTVSFVSAGTCTITADQAGNDKYNAAKQVSANIIVAVAQIIKKDQMLSLTSGYSGVAGKTGVLTATSDAGLTGISFATTSKDICEISGNSITYKAEGTCTVTMKQTGNEQFNAVTQNVDISVISKGVFSLSITDKDKLPIFQAIEGDTLNINLTLKASTSDVGKKAKFYLKATTENTVLMLTSQGFVAATEPLQPVNATNIPLSQDKTDLPLYSGVLPAGKYVIYAAYQTTEGSRQDATSIFTVKKKQEISFANLPQNPKAGDKVDLTVTGGGSNNPISLSSTTLDTCTAQEKTVAFIAEGNCVISAKQVGNDLFADTLVTQTIIVKSAGVFSLNVTDKDGKSTEITNNEDELNIGVMFKAPTDDVGKAATFYLSVVVETTAGTTQLMFANGEWIAATTPLKAAASVNALSENEATLPLYSGKLGIGNYTIYAMYETADGKKVEATSVFKVTSKIYADAYATAKNDGKSDIYADAYATTKNDVKSDIYVTIYATAYDNARMHGASDAYAIAYATAKSNGKPEAYATGYADGYAIGYAYATSNGKYIRGARDSSHIYANIFEDAYATSKNDGKSDSYSDAYAHAYATAVNAGKSYTNATAYATVYVTIYEHARNTGKSIGYADAFADAYARAKYDGKSDSYADIYATVYASEKDAGSYTNADAYATAYANAKNDEKSDSYATAYAMIYADAKYNGDSDKDAISHADAYATSYAIAYANAKNNGKSDSYADGYASAYAAAKNAGDSDTDAIAYANDYATFYATIY